MKQLTALLIASALALLLAACNTVAGVGKDVQAGGRAVEKAAEEIQHK
ncbi:MAG: entericidin A/B family lipoprotein [Burkholderiaceae bacterium]|jgi:entericidin B|nr:entericidin A/B family lipoprotein [Burkholderiaceae bacterium]